MEPEIKEVEQSDLETGDQIAVRGNFEDLHPKLPAIAGDTYLHHGIYNKEDNSVIDLHGNTKVDAKPQKCDFEEFSSGHDKVYRVEYKDGECLSVNDTMQRANEAVKRGSSWPKYHLVENNCETFATQQKTGVARSRQFEEIVKSRKVQEIKKSLQAIGAATASLGISGSSGSGSLRSGSSGSGSLGSGSLGSGSLGSGSLGSGSLGSGSLGSGSLGIGSLGIGSFASGSLGSGSLGSGSLGSGSLGSNSLGLIRPNKEKPNSLF